MSDYDCEECGKKAYDSKARAEKKAKEYARLGHGGRRQRAYQCKCKLWCLTTQKIWNKYKKKNKKK